MLSMAMQSLTTSFVSQRCQVDSEPVLVYGRGVSEICRNAATSRIITGFVAIRIVKHKGPTKILINPKSINKDKAESGPLFWFPWPVKRVFLSVVSAIRCCALVGGRTATRCVGTKICSCAAVVAGAADKVAVLRRSHDNL